MVPRCSHPTADLFSALDDRAPIDKVVVPEAVRDALAKPNSTLLLSISGGRDSDTMARLLLALKEREGWPCRVFAIHADLGDMEWHESGPHCEALCAELGIELVVVQHAQHDLLAGIEARMRRRPDSPPFPSAAARYCTSGWKRNPISRWIRNHIDDGDACVCAIGLRAEESRARAKKPAWARRPDADSPRKQRTVLDWHPILDLESEDVWHTIGYTLDELEAWQATVADWRANGLSGRDLTTKIREAGFRAHPAYAMGNQRLSCALCVLANPGDLANGAEARPDTYRRLRAIERASGYAFQQNKPLAASVAKGRVAA